MRIVITGGTSGIGEATAVHLLKKGHTVYSISRRAGNISGINYLKADVTDRASLELAFNQIANDGGIDVLINNVGIGISGAFEFHQFEHIDQIIDVNLKGLINASKLCLPFLRKSKGKLINVGSVAGELAIPFQSMYSALKSAVHNFTFSLANELKPTGVKVCCVMPGDTKTKFTKNRIKNCDDGLYSQRAKRSVEKMEKDEQKGAHPIKVAKVIEKCIKKKNPPLKVAVGFGYKFLLFLSRFLPHKLVNYVLYGIYAK